MVKRINIVLPETTLKTVDRVAEPGQRSRFINDAVQYFVTHRTTEALRSQLESAALRDRDLDGEISTDWLAVDEEAWRQLDTTRDAVKSTSRRSIQR